MLALQTVFGSGEALLDGQMHVGSASASGVAVDGYKRRGGVWAGCGLVIGGKLEAIGLD